jgi:hypothetical protein
MTEFLTAPSTREAYDSCMCDDEWETGRIFIVPSERVIGISWAWPVAVTAEEGAIHGASVDPRTLSGDDIMDARLEASIGPALDLARERGWKLASWAE